MKAGWQAIPVFDTSGVLYKHVTGKGPSQHDCLLRIEGLLEQLVEHIVRERGGV